MAADLEFYFDPVCPWAWITSRWVTNVQQERNYEVSWKFISLRMVNDAPLRTDEGHYLLDLNLKRIGNPRQLALVLNQIPGVVSVGLFARRKADVVIVGTATPTVL